MPNKKKEKKNKNYIKLTFNREKNTHSLKIKGVSVKELMIAIQDLEQTIEVETGLPYKIAYIAMNAENSLAEEKTETEDTSNKKEGVKNDREKNSKTS